LTAELRTLGDFIRYATSRFNAADLSFTQGFQSALDEASYLVLSTLHLPHDLPPAYIGSALLAEERELLLERIRQRVEERVPVAYLTGEAWFAGLCFKVSPAVLIPRSPIAELIERGFEPWIGGRALQRALDLCCGSGCIGIAMAAHQPELMVDLVDVSADALALARENASDHGVSDWVEVVESDLYAALGGRRYDLIVCNPPYVGQAEYAGLPGEFRHEPELALVSGSDGLDLPLQVLAGAPEHLEPGGLLVLEVGASEEALTSLLPELPLTWVEFQRGGSGVAVIDRESLLAHLGDVQAALAARGLKA
jgi:ribosomal protein L3 glutamine methyltransferase